MCITYYTHNSLSLTHTQTHTHTPPLTPPPHTHNCNLIVSSLRGNDDTMRPEVTDRESKALPCSELRPPIPPPPPAPSAVCLPSRGAAAASIARALSRSLSRS